MDKSEEIHSLGARAQVLTLVAEIEDDQAIRGGVIVTANARARIVSRPRAVRRTILERDHGHAVGWEAELEATVAEVAEEILGQRLADRQRRLGIVCIRVTEA